MTTLTATATGHAFAKVVAAGALVTLAAGGAAAVTGSLPTGLQARVSDSAARVGIELPDPRLEGGIRIGADQTIRVGEAGQVQVGSETARFPSGTFRPAPDGRPASEPPGRIEPSWSSPPTTSRSSSRSPSSTGGSRPR
jgi:hypothetical protein